LMPLDTVGLDQHQQPYVSGSGSLSKSWENSSKPPVTGLLGNWR
jgi:hypothetical protein